jgi:hypothetical protein
VANGTATIPPQLVTAGATTYRIEGAGTFDYLTKTLVVPYTVRNNATNALVDDNVHTFTIQ